MGDKMGRQSGEVKFTNKADEQRFRQEWDYWSQLVKEKTKGKVIYIVSEEDRRMGSIYGIQRYSIN